MQRITATEIVAKMEHWRVRSDAVMEKLCQDLLHPYFDRIVDLLKFEMLKSKMLIRSQYICFYVGRDVARCMDKEIFFGLFPTYPEKDGHLIKFRFYIDVGWNWKPTLYYMYRSYFPYDNKTESGDWTGRYWELYDWSWPFYLRFK